MTMTAKQWNREESRRFSPETIDRTTQNQGFDDAPADSRVRFYREDGTCYAILAARQFKKLAKSQSGLDDWLMEQKNSGVVLEVTANQSEPDPQGEEEQVAAWYRAEIQDGRSASVSLSLTAQFFGVSRPTAAAMISRGARVR